jgi:hypothetical protein
MRQLRCSDKLLVGGGGGTERDIIKDSWKHERNGRMEK